MAGPRSPGRLFIFLVRCALLLFVGALASGLAAQDVDLRGQATLATLPQSNEALVLSSQVEQALQVGDHRLAIELIERIMALPSNLVAAPASRTFYPVWRHAFLLYGQLSEQGVAQYRQLYDGEVRARLEQARKRSDITALRELFHRYPVSSHWASVGAELVALLLDQGRYGEAIEVLREMRWAGVADPVQQDLQLTVALGKAGAWGAAERIAGRLRENASGSAMDAVDNWLRTSRQVVSEQARYLIEQRTLWQVPVDRPGVGDTRNADLEVFDAIEALQRLPLITPLSVGANLVLRSDGRIRALDRLTLTPLWDVPEIASTENPFSQPDPGADFLRPGGRATTLRFSRATNLLLGNQFRHLIAGDDQRVYTVESIMLRAGDDRHTRSFTTTDPAKYPNILVARDLRTGAVIWQTGRDGGVGQSQLEFQDRPLVLDGRLVVPARQGDRVNLLEIEATTGRLLREVPVVGPPIHFTREGGRFQTLADETTIYLATGNGVVAALGRDSLEWKWASIYPSTVAEHLGRLWWKPPVEPRESAIDRPVLANDLLVLAPIDSLEIFALDRFSGRERWRVPRREFTHLVGAVSSGLVVGGNALVCLDLNRPDGPVKWRSVSLEVVGRSVIRGDRVYVPTRRGLVVLDGATGKVLADQLDPTMQVLDDQMESFAVLASEDGLYCLNSARVTKFAAPRITRQQAESAASGPAPFRGVLGQAWLAAIYGHHQDARSMLVDLRCDVPSYERTRRQLLLHVCLQLAGEAESPRDRIEWLRQADGLAETDDQKSRLALQIGTALEQLGDWNQTASHYCSLLDRTHPLSVPREPGEAGPRRVATWLEALTRLKRLGATLDQAQDALRNFVRGATTSDLALQRLFQALPAGEVRQEVAARLLRSPLPPELKRPYLQETFAPDLLPEDVYRETLVRRWETFVALGELEAANEAGKAVAALPVDQPTAAERQLLRSIRLSAGKLQRGPAPFGTELSQLWRIANTELLLDPDALTNDWWHWLPVRHHSDHEVQIIQVGRHSDYPHRRTFDGMADGGRDVQAEDLDRAVMQMRESESRRAFWPLRRTRSLAVIPVPDGIVALGLGPERSGGQRLWEYRLGHGASIPEGLLSGMAVDPLGVCLRERPGRVVRLEWANGAVAWQRDFGKLDVRQLIVHRDRLLLRTDDQRLWSCRLEDGGDLRVLPLLESAQRVETIGDLVLVASTRGLAAFGWGAEGYELRWARPADRIPQFEPVVGRPWVLVRQTNAEAWELLDATSGDPVFDAAITPFQSVEDAAVRGDQLIVAGRVRGIPERMDPAELAAFDVETGQPVWRRQLETIVSFNPTQLVGHERYIPVVRYLGDEVDQPAWPELVLVDRTNGRITQQFGLEGGYERGEPGRCDLQVLVAGGQILIQVDQHVLAYGSPAEDP